MYIITVLDMSINLNMPVNNINVKQYIKYKQTLLGILLQLVEQAQINIKPLIFFGSFQSVQNNFIFNKSEQQGQSNFISLPFIYFIMHKKAFSSIPSTRPDQFIMHTNASQSIIHQPKVLLAKILSLMKQSLSLRPYLLPRDIQEIYTNYGVYINQLLYFSSANQLFNALDIDKDKVWLQRQQLSFLMKFVTAYTERKNQYSNEQRFLQFTQTKRLIEWLQQQIIEYQKLVRLRVKQKLSNKLQKAKKQRALIFDKNSHETIQDYRQYQNKTVMSLKKRQFFQASALEKDLIEKIKEDQHKIRPSLSLQKAKDTSLLLKLAPFKHEKKRVYECETLRNDLHNTIQQDLNKQQDKIEHIKRVQRLKLKRRQEKQKSVIYKKLESNRNKILSNLKLQQQQLRRSEQIKELRMSQEAEKLTNERVSWVKNSIRAYSQRQQSKKIRQILRNHHTTTQFINNIQQIGLCTSIYSPKYSTINMSCTEVLKQQKKKRYDQSLYQNKLLKKIKRDTELFTDEQINLSSNRKSLVDLYDKNLSLI